MMQIFYYINQPCTPSFPIGLVKTESDFNVRSTETFVFWHLSCHLEVTEIGVFLAALCCLILRRPNLEVATRPFHKQVKILRQFQFHVTLGKVSLQLLLVVQILVDFVLTQSALLDLFIYFDASIFSKMTFPPLGNSDHVAFSVFIDSPPNSKQNVPFHCMTYEHSCADCRLCNMRHKIT